VQPALDEQQQRIIQRVVQELQDISLMMRHQHKESLDALLGINTQLQPGVLASLGRSDKEATGSKDVAQPGTAKSDQTTGSKDIAQPGTAKSDLTTGSKDIAQPGTADSDLTTGSNDSAQPGTAKSQGTNGNTPVTLGDSNSGAPPARNYEDALLEKKSKSKVQFAEEPEGGDFQREGGDRASTEMKRARMTVTVQKRLKNREQKLASMKESEAVDTAAEFTEWFKLHEKDLQTMDRGMFPDKNQMKKQLQENLIVQEYDVRDCYWETGLFQLIAKSPKFETLTMVVIFLNAIWIAVDVDQNKEDSLMNAKTQFQVIENCFATYFFVELVIRFGAFERKINCLKDFWFAFDSVLVLQVVLEIWVMYIIWFCTGGQLTFSSGPLTLLKVVRLCRTARIVRLLRQFPELLVLIRGIGIALRSVFFTFVLLIVLTYVFSIGLKILTEGDPDVNDDFFPTVWIGVKNMLLWAIVPDLEDKFETIKESGFLATVAFTIFIFLVSLTMLNMLVGVLVEVIGIVSSVEREQLEINHMKEGLSQLLLQADMDCSGHVTIKEFIKLLENRSAVQFLNSVGIDAVALVDISEYLFKGREEYEYTEMVHALLELRGSNTCTVKDVIDLRKWLIHQLQEMTDCIQSQGKRPSKFTNH